MFVFDIQVNHIKQNATMFKLFNLLKSRLVLFGNNCKLKNCDNRVMLNYI